MTQPLPVWPAGYRRTTLAVLPQSDATWDALLICVAAYICGAVGRVHQLFPVLVLFKPVLVAGVLSIVLYLAAARGIRGVQTLWSPTTRYVLLLLLWAALSVPGALYPGGAFRLLVDGFIKTVAIYLVIVGAVRGPRDVERLAFVYFLSAAVHAAVVVSPFSSSDSSRLGYLYYYDANDFATFAVSAIPLGLYFQLRRHQLPRRVCAVLGLVALAAAFVRYGSRGGFLALASVATFFLIGYRSVRLRWRVLGTGLLGLVLVLVASEGYWQRMETLLHPEEDYNYTAPSGRLQLWQRGMGYILERPLFGVGAGNFGTAEGRISPRAKLQEQGIGVKWSAPHNSFVQIGAELGVPGLVFFLGVIVTTFAALSAVRRAESRAAPLGRGPPRLAHPMMASLVGLIVGACFLSFGYEAVLYTLAALAVALRKVTPTATVAVPRGGRVLARRPR